MICKSLEVFLSFQLGASEVLAERCKLEKTDEKLKFCPRDHDSVK